MLGFYCHRVVTLLLLSFISCATLAASNWPDYEFKQLEQVRSFSESRLGGWAPVNDQVLIMTSSPRIKYLVVLIRPDYNLTFSHQLAVTSRGGRVMARADKVYAIDDSLTQGIHIKYIYKLEGKEQVELAHQLVEQAELAFKQQKQP